ncbi:MAG: hypothetical protein KG012_08440, partial [Deltaproteobacteria bacterium]|nr:hypothetical protein [Deltaproteobacteria bacterium]
WEKPYNRDRIQRKFGFYRNYPIALLCKSCHKYIHEWLKNPHNMLFERSCEFCGKAVLIGFDGDVEVSYELEGVSCHYDSAEVQIEAFKKNTQRV